MMNVKSIILIMAMTLGIDSDDGYSYGDVKIEDEHNDDDDYNSLSSRDCCDVL